MLVVELFWEGKKFGELPLNKGKKKQERDIGISKYKRKKIKVNKFAENKLERQKTYLVLSFF